MLSVHHIKILLAYAGYSPFTTYTHVCHVDRSVNTTTTHVQHRVLCRNIYIVSWDLDWVLYKTADEQVANLLMPTQPPTLIGIENK